MKRQFSAWHVPHKPKMASWHEKMASAVFLVSRKHHETGAPSKKTFILWMDEFLHQLRNLGRKIPAITYQQEATNRNKQWLQPWFLGWCERILSIHSMSCWGLIVVSGSDCGLRHFQGSGSTPISRTYHRPVLAKPKDVKDLARPGRIFCLEAVSFNIKSQLLLFL